MMGLRNECLAVSQKYLDLLQENDNFKLQLKELNATFSQSREVRDLNSRVQAIENRIQKLTFSTDASLKDIRDDLTVSNIQLQNISAEIWEGNSSFQICQTLIIFSLIGKSENVMRLFYNLIR